MTDKITAGMVAAELRKLADGLDKEPEAEVIEPSIYFSCSYSRQPKEFFLNLAKLLPRPLKKIFNDTEIRLEYSSPALSVSAYTKRSVLCTLLEPAKPAVFKCDPILSPEEEAQLEGAA